MTNVLILEDNLEVAEAMKSIILKIDQRAEIHIETKAASGYKTALESTVSLFLIDIILDKTKKGDVSGLDFASSIRNIPKYKHADMIIMSALIDEKLYAYSQLHCYSYLEKPFDIQTTEEILTELIQHRCSETARENRKEQTLFIRSEGIFYPVKESEIIYIEFHSRHSILITRENSYKVHKSVIRDWLEKSDRNRFVICSRFEAVNMDYVEYIDLRLGILRLRNIDKLIKIGQNGRKNILEVMNSR